MGLRGRRRFTARPAGAAVYAAGPSMGRVAPPRAPMTKLPPMIAPEVGFTDYKPAYTQTQALAEANRCFYCVDAPCVAALPDGDQHPRVHPQDLHGQRRGRGADDLQPANVLGMSCARVCPVEVLCVGACVYNDLDSPPIEIGKLQRYATDAAFAAGWEFFTAGPDTGKSVGPGRRRPGVAGGGPRAASARARGHDLRRGRAARRPQHHRRRALQDARRPGAARGRVGAEDRRRRGRAATSRSVVSSASKICAAGIRRW
jgi:hypothetical protein